LIFVLQLGTIDYATGLALQQQLVALRKEEKIGDVLLLLEHKPVITLGRNAKAQNVVASPEFLKQRGVELFECDRGGDVTFHGPGQIVGYPIFDLRGYPGSSSLSSRAEQSDAKNRSVESRDLGSPARRYLGAVEFVRRLEEVLIRTCADFTISTKRVAGLTGVWTDPQSWSRPANPQSLSYRGNPQPFSSRAEENDLKSRSLESTCPEQAKRAEGDLGFAGAANAAEAKLAAIGVHISRFATSHGFALNVNTDLSYFNLIVPCGITTRPVTSMQRELDRELDLNAVAESISRNFGVVFQSQILWLKSLDALLNGSLLPAR